MPEPRSLWGEVWSFWAGGGDEAWEGGFVVWERDGRVERGVQGGGLWALVGEGAAGAGCGGGGDEGAAAAYGGGSAAQPATRSYLGGLADGAAGIAILVQFDDIDIQTSCAEGCGLAGDGVAAIGGLNEGAPTVIAFSVDGFGPLEVSVGIQLDDIDVGLSCAEGQGDAGDGVAAIGGLNEGVALLTLWSADGFGPLEVSIGIQLDDINIVVSCPERFGEAGDGVAAIGGLNEGLARLILWSADSLTEVGGGAGGRDGIRREGSLDVRTLR